jgi:hypothetical protein
VERVARLPVSEDQRTPEVCIIGTSRTLTHPLHFPIVFIVSDPESLIPDSIQLLRLNADPDPDPGF